MNLGGAIHINKKLCLFLCVLLFVVYYISPFSSQQKRIENKINLKQLLKTAILAAESGGVEVKSNKDNQNVESKGKTREGAEDSVTVADHKSHCVMQRIIKKRFPTVRLVSEESKTNCEKLNISVSQHQYTAEVSDHLEDTWILEDDVTVWIDPLDATKEYTEGLYNFVTTMVCVAVKDRPVIGVIHKPFLKETYWGWVDVTKSSNLFIHSKNRKELVFIVSRSHTGKVNDLINDKFQNFDKKIIEAGGAGYKVLEVINGTADVYLHKTAIKKWDICAGNALLLTLGGKMTTLQNRLIDYYDIENKENIDGLIATLKDHIMYINQIAPQLID